MRLLPAVSSYRRFVVPECEVRRHRPPADLHSSPAAAFPCRQAGSAAALKIPGRS